MVSSIIKIENRGRACISLPNHATSVIGRSKEWTIARRKPLENASVWCSAFVEWWETVDAGESCCCNPPVWGEPMGVSEGEKDWFGVEGASVGFPSPRRRIRCKSRKHPTKWTSDGWSFELNLNSGVISFELFTFSSSAAILLMSDFSFHHRKETDHCQAQERFQVSRMWNQYWSLSHRRHLDMQLFLLSRRSLPLKFENPFVLNSWFLIYWHASSEQRGEGACLAAALGVVIVIPPNVRCLFINVLRWSGSDGIVLRPTDIRVRKEGP